MSDPYKVLGVSPSSTDEEIKKKYRALVKQYHPDNYTDNPLAELAAEKMKEINEAYDEIQKMRASGQSNSYSSSQNSSSQGASSGVFSQVRQYINAGRLSEAETILNRVSVSDRTAEWHFLKGVILYRNGWIQDARNEIETACSMDPYNSEYRSFQQRMNAGSAQSPYSNVGSTDAMSCDLCESFSTCLCLNCLCNGLCNSFRC